MVRSWRFPWQVKILLEPVDHRSYLGPTSREVQLSLDLCGAV